jgi:AraC-like DNA-binding protein
LRKYLRREMPQLIAGLSPGTLFFPGMAKGLARGRRTRHRGPVPTHFYGGPTAHAHDRVEIASVVEGGLFFEIEGEGYALRKNDVVLLPPRTAHYDSYIDPGQAYALIWYLLWPNRPRVTLTRYRPRRGFEFVSAMELRSDLLPEDDWAFISSLRRTPVLREGFARPSQPKALLRRSGRGRPTKLQRRRARAPSLMRVRDLLFGLYGAALEAARRTGPVRRREAVRKVVRDAVTFLREHLAEAPGVEQAAEYVGLSPTYLTTLARKELGRPLHDILNDMRMERAKELLAGSGRSVKEIAHLSGFADPDYFSRAFRRATGRSPTEYREKA